MTIKLEKRKTVFFLLSPTEDDVTLAFPFNTNSLVAFKFGFFFFFGLISLFIKII